MSTKRNKGTSVLKPGPVMILSTADKDDREVYVYQNPEQFVALMRERDCAHLEETAPPVTLDEAVKPDGTVDEEKLKLALEALQLSSGAYASQPLEAPKQVVLRKMMMSNQDYMRTVSMVISKAVGVKDVAIPYHNEQAFLEALFRLGVCVPVVMN
jgi:hypothetical protein